MGELINRRKWDSKTFDTGKKEKGKPIYGTKLQNGLHDIEPNGSFVDCDKRVSEVTQGVTYLKMNRGRMGELRFGDSSHPNSFLVKIKNKGLKGVSFKYTGANGNSMTANNGKPLCNFDNGISIESTPYYKGVKMDIIVSDPLTAPIEYPFSIKTYGQDYDFIEENGGVTLKGEDQESILIKPPYAIDANGDIGQVTIHYTGMDGNLITFKKVVDEEWLRQATAPVRIDPDVTIDDDSGTFIDTSIFEDFSGYNFGAGESIYSSNKSSGGQWSSLLKVDLSAYSNIEITSAKFGLDIFSVTSPIYITWHRILLSWIEGTKDFASATTGEPSYDDYAVPNPWNTAGCLGDGTDRQAIADGSATVTALSSDYPLDMSIATVQAWIDDSNDNNGILLSSPNVVAGKEIIARSSEALLGNKPYFYMEYTEDDSGSFFFFGDSSHE